MDDSFSISEFAMAYNLSKNTVRAKARECGLIPVTNNKNYEYALTSGDIDILKDNLFNKKSNLPKIIYRTEVIVYEIYPSKINFL